MNREAIQTLARAVIDTQASAVQALLHRVDEEFLKACGFLLGCRGRVVVIGMGKSGHIGSKIAATLASTGTPAFFVHPAEASHGDLGMIKPQDVVLALSNSGETDEVNIILPLLKRIGVKIVAMTGNPVSTLAEHADAHIDVSVEKEACPLGLAPTSSTTAALVMGDALAISLLETRGFTRKDFAMSHPGGRLGRRLLLHIQDVMHQGSEVPSVQLDASVSEAIVEMTAKRLGMTAVLDSAGQVAGIFTDGDLRRTLDSGLDPHTTAIGKVMTAGGQSITADALAVEAVQKMQAHSIQGLLVVAENGQLAGALNFQDLLKAGVV
ncbi:MAG: KpsF/GutQ family sugar-phosphate isomerase [Xanthomonadales bacterium]|nr:KpsF/GutQ family sugar-phosphate isomerase [Gammaproteobacteria bacterium]MBT8053055.1 KpsF/GutQ family sugar-phosphate isomerase [Gammaproteobacteria bacterium]NND56701.1 KpsF/GutQ family sugar-phosphate isomerase [Xanthomonadales bacterium]NNK52686.1 KpsF/GutQ family sugar-phosphate isomerase [Xanthomonadales bacterium]